jgi:1-acyl-sn-glycerol-3-phosphate acyltransferase
MPDLWYRFLSQLCVRVYFSRIDVLPARPSLSGPTLIVALHRNGALDGWVYKSIFPFATFMISAQLQKNLLARLFFTGIAVVRDKDQAEGGHSSNTDAMNRCYDLLGSGGTLAIFPEGTSSLGPRHLPLKSGAARIALEAAQRQVPVTILPLGITYDAPSTFRSNVQVIAGPLFSPSSFTLPELKREIASRLEALLAAYLAGRHFPDGTNVITLWRILIGAITFSLWFWLVLEFSLFSKSPLLFLAFLAVSLISLFAYTPWKRHLRHSFNALRAPSVRRDYLAFRSTLLQELCCHAS